MSSSFYPGGCEAPRGIRELAYYNSLNRDIIFAGTKYIFSAGKSLYGELNFLSPFPYWSKIARTLRLYLAKQDIT